MEGTNILVLSDTHGDIQVISDLLDSYNKLITDVIHLGDHSRDMIRFKNKYPQLNLHAVNGNTDPSTADGGERILNIGGKNIFITHGHRYGVKTGLDNIMYRADEMKADACFFGHTHVQTLFVKNNITFLNPGSPMFPAPENPRGYALVRIADGGISAKLLEYKETAWQKI